GHRRRRGQPFLAELAKALRFQEPALLPLLFDRRRTSLADRPLGVDAKLARPRQRQARWPVLAEGDGLASPVHPVIQPKREGPRRLYEDIHAVPVRHLVNFLFWFQMLKSCIGQHRDCLLQKRPSGRFRASSRQNLFFLQIVRSKKRPSKGAHTLTVSDEIGFRNGRRTVRKSVSGDLCRPIVLERLWIILFYLSVCYGGFRDAMG